MALPEQTEPHDLIRLPGGELGLLGEWSCELLVLDPAGDAFEIVQILALPDATPGSDEAAAMGLSGDGRFLYAGLRGSDRIAVVALADDGARAVGLVSSGGNWPRHLLVDDDLVHVANERSNADRDPAHPSRWPARSSRRLRGGLAHAAAQAPVSVRDTAAILIS